MTTERKDHYRAGTDNSSLIGYETVSFFEDDCQIEFTAKFNDMTGSSWSSYEDETVSVVGLHESIDVTSLLSEDKIEDLYRKAMSVRGKM